MKQGFHNIMNEHQQMIWRICRGYLDDQDDQKDLFQEIMNKIYSNFIKDHGPLLKRLNKNLHKLRK